MRCSAAGGHPLPFGSVPLFHRIAETWGTPLYVHDEGCHRRQASLMLNAPSAFGLSLRYAMKANPHGEVLRIFHKMGIGLDASSRFEADRAMAAGIPPERILLTSQEVPDPGHLWELVRKGVHFNCTSLAQLRLAAELFGGSGIPFSIRVNPGKGTGHNHRTQTAGRGASFGIWKDHLSQAQQVIARHRLLVTRIHSHVGSGGDWRVWRRAAELTLNTARGFPEVNTVNLGGGFRVDRMDPRRTVDLPRVFAPVKKAFERFAAGTGRKPVLEVEPGTFLAAGGCLLLSRVNDIADTGRRGYRFLKLDASMTELLRPMLYGARHPVVLLKESPRKTLSWVVVGTCCESGDLFTPRAGDPERLGTVALPPVEPGDLVAVLGTGAYGSAMSAVNYNSRPACAEVMIPGEGAPRLITRRQEPEEVWSREIPPGMTDTNGGAIMRPAAFAIREWNE